MTSILRTIFTSAIETMDSNGCPDFDEEAVAEIAKVVEKHINPDYEMSKYQAYTYLGIGRSTFDMKVAKGELPRGRKVAGFKELRWNKKDLDAARNKVNP